MMYIYISHGCTYHSMSTKCTIAHGENFHFYHEVLDDDHVYLELRTTHFEADYGRVLISLPIHIWETIRHLGGAQLDLVEKEDEDLLAMVKAEVEERITRHDAIARQHPDRAAFAKILGSLPYGLADTPRAEQIQKGIEYFRRERQRQREVRDRIAALRTANASLR
jgi:hypothetical protein